jgi:hypothetical protein
MTYYEEVKWDVVEKGKQGMENGKWMGGTEWMQVLANVYAWGLYK